MGFEEADITEYVVQFPILLYFELFQDSSGHRELKHALRRALKVSF
jgi:hypothetical protein